VEEQETRLHYIKKEQAEEVINTNKSQPQLSSSIYADQESMATSFSALADLRAP
jgi:hypothetical protein